MKILVISDTHGAINLATDVINACRVGCDLVIHLGDTARDFERLKNTFPELAFVGVAGNNDFFCTGLEKECLLNLDGVKVFICHGHEYGVKRDTDSLFKHAQARDAQLVLFGHTHEPEKEFRDGTLLFNPGALISGRFGILHIHNGKIAGADSLVFDRFERKIL